MLLIMRKIFICLILSFCFFTTVYADNSDRVISVSLDNNDVCITVDGMKFESDEKPFIDNNGVTQVPARAFCDFLNKRIYWFEGPQRVAITTVPARPDNINAGGAGGDSITFIIGENWYEVNGQEYYMNTAADIINGRAYIPLRITGEFLKYKVIWEK